MVLFSATVPLVAQPGLAPSPVSSTGQALRQERRWGLPGFPRRAGEGEFRTRPYRRERLSASNIAYRRAATWVCPYGWSRAHPPHRIPHPHRAGEGGFQTRPYRRERLSASTIAYRRAATWVCPYGWSRAHPPHRIPHPHRAGEGGFQTRPYRRERLSASTIAYRRAATWVCPYGWSRAHPPHRIPHPPVKGEGVRCELSGCVVGLGFIRGVSGRGVWSRWVRSRGPARASAVGGFR